jgi:hypothetical protein
MTRHNQEYLLESLPPQIQEALIGLEERTNALLANQHRAVRFEICKETGLTEERGLYRDKNIAFTVFSNDFQTRFDSMFEIRDPSKTLPQGKLEIQAHPRLLTEYRTYFEIVSRDTGIEIDVQPRHPFFL